MTAYAARQRLALGLIKQAAAKRAELAGKHPVLL